MTDTTMQRRSFLTLLGTSAAVWPLAASAQRDGRVRRVGVLMSLAADDPESATRIAAFAQGMQELGWALGRNLRIEYRWGAGDSESIRKNAVELVALTPDVIVATGNSGVRPLQQATRTIPIVFVNVSDPVGGGLVASLSRPGGNSTGFSSIDYGMSGKWAELLKQISPRVTRVGVVRDPGVASGTGQLGAIQAVGPLLGMEVTPFDVRQINELEGTLANFSGQSNGGLIVTIGALAQVHRTRIITLAARHRLPSVYPYRFFVGEGGLISYGPESIDPWRRAAGYVDRILKGDRPADLPVQAPTKFETVLNMKTAKALGLKVPDIVLLRADEVIE